MRVGQGGSGYRERLGCPTALVSCGYQESACGNYKCCSNVVVK